MAKEFVHRNLLDGVRELIVSGTFESGTKVPEAALCERFGVSRTPLREVLKVLAAEGHVALLPNRGAQIKAPSAAEVRGLFDVTGALESLAGEQCCARATADQVAAIEALHERMLGEWKRRDLSAYYASNRGIHEAIVVATGNPVLLELYAQVNARIRRVRFASPMTEDIWNRAVAEHEGMLNALQRRDGASLATILKTHLLHKAEAILGQMAAADAPPAARATRRATARAAAAATGLEASPRSG